MMMIIIISIIIVIILDGGDLQSKSIWLRSISLASLPSYTTNHLSLTLDDIAVIIIFAFTIFNMFPSELINSYINF